MIRTFRIKILVIVLVTCILLLTIVLAFVFSATSEAMLSGSYGSMVWALEDIRRGIYYGVPWGAPRPMAILFMNEDGSLESADVDKQLRLVPELGDYEDIMHTLLQLDGSPSQYSVGGATYLYRHQDLEDGRHIFILTDVTRYIAVLKTFRQNALIDSAIAIAVMLVLAIVFANWIIRPIARAKESQQEFFLAASHDLRTPLTVILANTGLFEEVNGADPLLAMCFENIKAESEHMKQMLQVMLDHLSFEKLAANRKKLVKEDFNFSFLITKNIRSLESLFLSHDRKLLHDVPDNLWVRGNRNSLERVIGILLDNALKYSEEGSDIFVRLRPKNDKMLQLDVQSKSEPMDKKTLTKIFLPFYRADPSRNDSNSYGLGLSTAKNIIKLHNGKIWATVEKSENVFHISLPTVVFKIERQH
ncbi:MAG: HAMP domain-containing histidine kinase [Oscillospiraceae bacterium]|nr:HAMP domain-containing histidine kinase [Oscillospiraceae bacterium]